MFFLINFKTSLQKKSILIVSMLSLGIKNNVLMKISLFDLFLSIRLLKIS